MRLQQLLVNLSTGLLAFIIKGPNHLSREILTTSIPCFNPLPSTLEDLITCFDYTVPQNTYLDAAAYNAAQPTGDELTAWKTAVASLLAVDGTCSPGLLPQTLNGIYEITLFTETEGGKSFCILSELQATDEGHHYARGWGLFAVPATRRAVSRYIHVSAPHPIYDPGTPKQAAANFRNTGAKSLLISGRHRNAYMVDSCVGSDYSKTDAAHDINEPFFSANKEIRAWQTANGDCPSASCAYIQMHRQSSCPNDTTFLSAGLGRSASSVNWYNTVDSPVRRIRTQLNTAFPGWTNSLPSDTTSTCDLTATKNVFGRLLNGVDESSVCNTEANSGTVTGRFVHIEQSDGALVPTNYATFAMVLNRAMATTCDTGMVMDPTTLLCV